MSNCSISLLHTCHVTMNTDFSPNVYIYSHAEAYQLLKFLRPKTSISMGGNLRMNVDVLRFKKPITVIDLGRGLVPMHVY